MKAAAGELVSLRVLDLDDPATCFAAPCDEPAAGRLHGMAVIASPAGDPGVQEQAARLQRLGIPLCRAHLVTFSGDR